MTKEKKRKQLRQVLVSWNLTTLIFTLYIGCVLMSIGLLKIGKFFLHQTTLFGHRWKLLSRKDLPRVLESAIALCQCSWTCYHSAKSNPSLTKSNVTHISHRQEWMSSILSMVSSSRVMLQLVQNTLQTAMTTLKTNNFALMIQLWKRSQLLKERLQPKLSLLGIFRENLSHLSRLRKKSASLRTFLPLMIATSLLMKLRRSMLSIATFVSTIQGTCLTSLLTGTVLHTSTDFTGF